MSVIYSNSSPSYESCSSTLEEASPSYESCSSTLEEYRSPRGPAPPQVAQALRLPPTGLTAGPTARPPVGFGASGATCAGAHDPGPKAPFAVAPFLQVFAPPARCNLRRRTRSGAEGAVRGGTIPAGVRSSGEAGGAEEGPGDDVRGGTIAAGVRSSGEAGGAEEGPGDGVTEGAAAEGTGCPGCQKNVNWIF
ncbi:hypothetical protein QE152_g29221 [Popillia japonica]|uniref:Uncharacterized protein n=1 Tax=Popillia japonica TaxID=7064 RepID=A0AAW1JJJ7_POPJA